MIGCVSAGSDRIRGVVPSVRHRGTVFASVNSAAILVPGCNPFAKEETSTAQRAKTDSLSAPSDARSNLFPVIGDAIWNLGRGERYQTRETVGKVNLAGPARDDDPPVDDSPEKALPRGSQNPLTRA